MDGRNESDIQQLQRFFTNTLHKHHQHASQEQEGLIHHQQQRQFHLEQLHHELQQRQLDKLQLSSIASTSEVAAATLHTFASQMVAPATDAENCVHVSDAILAQGIDDVTSRAYVQLLFGLVYGGLFALGLTGNGGVLWAVTRNKRLRSARNIFLLNLILTDLLLCLTGVPVTPWYALSKEWRFGSLMCRLMPLSNSCAVFVTSWSLTAIALDKFMHIIDPTREPFSLRLAGFVTILIWLICSLINIPYLMSYELVDGSYYVPKNSTPFCGRFCDEINWQGETQRRLYGSTVMLFQFVVPMAIITYCYWRILDKVHKDMIIQNTQFSQSLTNSQRIDAVNRKKRVNYILIGMVLAFIGCWLPMTAVNLAKDFKREPAFIRRQPYFWPLVAHVIAMSTVIWNPLLFFWLTRKQKRSKLGGFLHTSEIVTSLASRVHSLRSTSGGSTTENRFKRRHQQSFDSAATISRNNSSIHNNNNSMINNNNYYCATPNHKNINNIYDMSQPNRPLLSKDNNGRSSGSSSAGDRLSSRNSFNNNNNNDSMVEPKRTSPNHQQHHTVVQKTVSLSSHML